MSFQQPQSSKAPSFGPSANTAASRHTTRVPPTPLELPETTPSIQELQTSNALPLNFPTESMILTMRLPPKQPTEPRRIIIMDVTSSFFNTIVDTLKRISPSSIMSSAWKIGLLIGIGPCPLGTGDELTQYMFQIVFRWPPSSSITTAQVQQIISEATASENLSISIITRSRRHDQPPTSFTDTPLTCTAFFSSNLETATPLSLKIKSTSLSYQFTLTLHDNCPDDRIRKVLTSISSSILNKEASLADSDQVFQRVTPIHKDPTSAPRISNNWRHVAIFQRTPNDECRDKFNQLLNLHKDQRSKHLLPTDDPTAKIKNATFSFFNEMKQSKIKKNTNLIEWMVSTFESFISQHSSLQNTTDTESSSSEKSRDKANPWGAPLKNLVLPASLPPFNETLHQYQKQKTAHLNQPKTVFPPSSTSLSPLESTPFSISFTKTENGTAYTIEKPILFTHYDFGQFITLDGKTFGNCCLLLCLAAAAKLNPVNLAQYFTARQQMLCDANTLYEKHESIRDAWASFCSTTNFSHLASNFPRTSLEQEWAGSFSLGTAIDFNHICSLAPSEICSCSILVITDNSSSENSNCSDVSIEASFAGNKLAYFPPKILNQTTPQTTIIILHRDNHYTLLTPTTPETDCMNQLLSIFNTSNPLRHLQYIPSEYSHSTPPFAHLVGLSLPCADIHDMETAHQLLHKDICDGLDRSHPRSQDMQDDAECPQPPPGSHPCLPIIIDDSPPCNPYLLSPKTLHNHN